MNGHAAELHGAMRRDDRLAGGHEHFPLDLVIETLRALARDGELPATIAGEVLHADTVIDDLGLDSMGKLSLLGAVEERADLALPEAALSGIRTLGDLARAVAWTRGLA
jgi:acyl carrier protein